MSGKESPVGKALLPALVLVAKGKPEGNVISATFVLDAKGKPEGNWVRVMAILDDLQISKGQVGGRCRYHYSKM